LVLGIGAGWHEPEFRAFGYPFDHLASRFEDALRVIAPLVRQGEVDYQGKYERAVNAVSLPRGPRPSGPPILIGASRPRMLRLTAQFADAWNTCWLGRAGELSDRLTPIHEACAEVGRDPETLDVTVGQIVTFPGLADEDDFPGETDRFLFADASSLAAEWSNFASQGVRHLIVWPTPYDPECLAQVTEALRTYRGGTDV
jgi:alkanesulfonate monooxygenase SsuD/methylene tetrahydromethanopterin reductase-like flavin-dependent oxidoreductase (luciferase family)